MLTTLWTLLAITMVTQFFYWLKFLFPLVKYRLDPSNKTDETGVSVLICAKNEAENLKINLPIVLTQNYANYEVVVMDDHSEDNSMEVLKTLKEQFGHLHFYSASDQIKEQVGKKAVLAEGVSKAKHERLLLTDADCQPESQNWLKQMTADLDQKEIVLGVGQYQSSGKWFDSFVQYETLRTAFSYLGFALSGNPYMGVGRNLAINKNTFNKEAYSDNWQLASGDDDLQVQAVANEMNTSIRISDGSHTFSDPPFDFASWVKQKARHYSTASFYKSKYKSWLFIGKWVEYMPNFLVIALIIFSDDLMLPLLVWLFRWMLWMLFFNALKEKLRFSHPIYLLPFLEIFFAFFDLWLTIANRMNKRIQEA